MLSVRVMLRGNARQIAALTFGAVVGALLGLLALAVACEAFDGRLVNI